MVPFYYKYINNKEIIFYYCIFSVSGLQKGHIKKSKKVFLNTHKQLLIIVPVGSNICYCYA